MIRLSKVVGLVPILFIAVVLVDECKSQVGFESDVRPFLTEYCVECHGPNAQEADLRIDTLDPTFDDRYSAEIWSEVLDRLNGGDMPPEEKPRPDSSQQEVVTDWITASLQIAIEKQQQNGGQVVLRRLNRNQYNNTIRDLIGLDYKPADAFPEDPSGFGFDNVGTALNLSPSHIEQYLQTAREIVRRAKLNGVKPATFKWRFEADVPARLGKEHRLSKPNRRGRMLQYAIVYARDMPARDGFAVVRMKRRHDVGVRSFRVHRPGRYLIRIRAAAYVPTRADVESAAMKLHDNLHQTQLRKVESEERKTAMQRYWDITYREQLRQHYATDPMYDYGPPRMRTVVNKTIPVSSVDVTVGIGDAKVFEFPAYLDKTLCEIQITNDYNIPEMPYSRRFLYVDEFPRPELLIDWFEVEGPLDEEWPPKGRKEILRSFAEDDPIRARKVLATFMKRAYRRPLRRGEVNQMLRLFEASYRESKDFESALEIPLVAILSSPHFLHLVEEQPSAGSDGRVGEYELANRLSYWLWNTMPDQALFQLAQQGELSNEDVLLGQIDRMLSDPKSDAFVRSFTTQWLQIRDLSSVSPDERKFTRFDDHLLWSLAEESVSFFHELLDHDLPVSNFLQSDFAMLNQRLARHYSLPVVEGDQLRRVALPAGARRGPLLTQASVHMATSNGTRTSPVKRGAWILENVLGTPPPPPPPNAGDIKPGVPGINKATVRERLEAHRKNAACAPCHNKIDPLGFALENFRGDGSWATQEANGWQGWIDANDPPIDASAKMPNGTELNGIEDLQNVLLEQEHKFLRCLAEKLATYALGRGMEYSDREWLDSLVANMQSSGKTLRGLIKDIVASDQFNTK